MNYKGLAVIAKNERAMMIATEAVLDAALT